MELVFIKGIALGVVLLISLIGGFVPLLMTKRTQNGQRRKYKRLISFVSCYGGGVFFGASLLDLLPDVRESFQEVFHDLDIDANNFPIVEFVVSVGFFIVFIIEQLILAWKETSVVISINRSERQRLIDENEVETDGQRRYSSTDENVIVQASSSSINHVNNSSDNNNHDHLQSIHEDPSSHSCLRTFILFLALSVHSIFEGLAIGLQSVIDHLIELLIAILIHKGIIALSLSINLVQSKLKFKSKMLAVLIFSFASPIGIGAGMLISHENTGSSLTSAILQGFACGTFLYVTFFEVLPHELNRKDDRLLKLLFIILGFCTICGAIVFNHYVDLP